MKKTALFITTAAIIAALYVVLTYFANLLGLANMAIQVRFSEHNCRMQSLGYHFRFLNDFECCCPDLCNRYSFPGNDKKGRIEENKNNIRNFGNRFGIDSSHSREYVCRSPGFNLCLSDDGTH